jgi:DNA mismatch repair protein MutS
MSPRDPKQKPMMRQYAEAKAAYPDAIVFFRLGDFYEMFFEDAVKGSEILGITLTSRNRENPKEEPMAGVPHHSAHTYIARLLAAGHKVAICEQLGDASKIKGIVPRAVVRVVTPGLVTGDSELEARENHYLAAVETAGDGGAIGLALLDLSTGELLTGEVDDASLLVAELVRAAPHEILLAPSAHGLEAALRLSVPGAALRLEAALARPAAEIIGESLGEDAARDAAVVHGPAALGAAGRAVAFAASCTPGRRLPIQRVGVLDAVHSMRLDETAQAHLEVVRAQDGGKKGTLIDTIDRTVTPAGARLLRQRLLAPLYDVHAIRARHDQVELFVIHARARDELRAALAAVGDLERLAVKVALGDATPRDLGRLRDGLNAAPAAARATMSLPATERALARLEADDLVTELGELLSRALSDDPPPTEKDGGFVREGYDAELDEARRVQRESTELVVALEAKLRRETGATSLRVRYTRVFGWYIEVTKTHLAKVPESWRRKQTIAGGERYSSGELDQLAAEIEGAEGRALERETSIFAELGKRARAVEKRVRALARLLAEWDVAAALAEVAHQYDYARPEVDDGDVIDIREGRHPVVERLAAQGRFVPNDTRLDLETGRLWLVTGPNMAGKSTLMRQVALIVLLAQAGAFVPASAAKIGIVDRLFSRVGASDNVSRGESTFMVEMRETASILSGATRRSLVILDEIGRGTSTYDGLAIAWAVAEHLHDVIGCRAMFATHYHELTELSKTSSHLENVSVSAREHDGGVVFLHSLERGPASKSYGVAVARLAGLPESVLARARALCTSFEAPRSTGKPASGSGPQLGLFEARATGATEEEKRALETVRTVDVDRITPMDALNLVAKLKASLGPR